MNMDISEEEEYQLWLRFKRDGENLRDYFTIKYAPLVKYVAGKIAFNIPESIEFDDLIGYGTFGLIDAINKFEPEKGIKFKTYGITRIRGQIYDELRSLDWVPRSVRQKYKQIEEERKKYEERFNEKASNEKLSELTGISLSEVERVSNLANDSNMGSLDDVWLGVGEDENSLMDTVESPDSMNPENMVEKVEIRKTIAEQIKKLPEKEKQVLILYYYEDLTLKEIGAVLNVTESRVSQLHTKAIIHIRQNIEDIKKSLV